MTGVLLTYFSPIDLFNFSDKSPNYIIQMKAHQMLNLCIFNPQIKYNGIQHQITIF